MALTSDPHAWLRPYYARLRERSAFAQFSPQHQFEQLVEAVAREYPSKAARMREWTPAAQHALLNHLASMVDQGQSAEQTDWQDRPMAESEAGFLDRFDLWLDGERERVPASAFEAQPFHWDLTRRASERAGEKGR